MSLEWAKEKVVQCWCDPRLQHRTLDVELVEVISEMVDRETSVPRLGCATTKELFQELMARIEMEPGDLMGYRTIETDEEFDKRILGMEKKVGILEPL